MVAPSNGRGAVLGRDPDRTAPAALGVEQGRRPAAPKPRQFGGKTPRSLSSPTHWERRVHTLLLLFLLLVTCVPVFYSRLSKRETPSFEVEPVPFVQLCLFCLFLSPKENCCGDQRFFAAALLLLVLLLPRPTEFDCCVAAAAAAAATKVLSLAPVRRADPPPPLTAFKGRVSARGRNTGPPLARPLRV